MKNIIAVKPNCYKGFGRKETFEGMANAGFRYIELSASPNCNTGIDRFKDFTTLCAIKEELKKLNLFPIAMGGHTDVMDKDVYVDFCNNLHLAHFFGCRYFVTSVGDPYKAENRLPDNEEVAEQLKRYLPLLEEYDMTIVLEVHGRYGNGKMLKEICRAVNSDRVKINYDTANAIFYSGFSNEELLEDIEDCMDEIAYMHIKEKANERNVWDFPALGKGYVPFETIFEKLEKAHNECPLVVEVEFTATGIKDSSEADEALRESYRYLKKQNLFEL